MSFLKQWSKLEKSAVASTFPEVTLFVYFFLLTRTERKQPAQAGLPWSNKCPDGKSGTQMLPFLVFQKARKFNLSPQVDTLLKMTCPELSCFYN